MSERTLVHIAAQAKKRRQAYGPSGFKLPLIKEKRVENIAQPKATTLKGNLYQIPYVGYWIKWMVIFFRLPLRLYQLQEQIDLLRFLLQDANNAANGAKRAVDIVLEKNHELFVRQEQVGQKLQKIDLDFQETSSLVRSFAKQDFVKKETAPVCSSGGENLSSAEDLNQAHLDDFYFRFEEHFRGGFDEIKARLKNSYAAELEVLRKGPKAKAVDLGCGRGEWLQLVQEAGMIPVGVEMNERMLAETKKLKLDVVQMDALAYLQAQESGSHGLITGFHIVEHLKPSYLIDMVRECFRVLKKGGFVIFETPNPENVLVGSCSFYTDLTHENPIPPHTLLFLLQYAGFAPIEIKRTHPFSLLSDQSSPALREDFGPLLRRFEMEQDYAAVGYKSESLFNK